MSVISLPNLSATYWPFQPEYLPENAFLVGGAVRDALLGRDREYLDLDFVLPKDAVQTARNIASLYKAGFVLLDSERQIARVVFKNATADFAQQEGESLETDLQRRDFTVNAIAYNPHTQELVDPLQGYSDLKAGLLKMVSPANLKDDPLRLLRAYRQAAQLGFVIEDQTQTVIRQLASMLTEIAAERVQSELNYLLNNLKATYWLTAAGKDGLLQTWLPHTTAKQFAQLSEIELAVSNLTQNWPLLGEKLQKTLSDSQKTSLLAVAKLASLLSTQIEQAEIQLTNLKYSRAEIRAVTTVIKGCTQLQSSTVEPLSVREQFFFFKEVGALFPAVVVLATALGTTVEDITPLINHYLNPEDQIAHPTALLTGNDLMRSLNLKPGKQIGQLLTEIQVARAEGKISTSSEAIKFASQLLDTQ